MNSPRPRFILTCSVASLMAAAASSARAQSVETWTGTTSKDWNTGSNWSQGVVPDNTNTTAFTNGVNAFVNTATGNIATVSTAVPTPNDIRIAYGPTGTVGRMDITAGSITSGGWTVVGATDGTTTTGGTGTLNIANTAATGGTFTGYGTGSGSHTISAQFHVGGTVINGAAVGGTGTVNINTTGTVTVGNDIYFGGNGPGSTGTLNMDAGTINQTGGWAFVGGDQNANGGGTGTLKQSGGTINFAGELHVGRGTGGVGTLTLTGGALNTGSLYIIGENGGTGTGTQSGTTTVGVGDQMWIGNSSSNANVYNVNGGSINVSSWVAIGRGGGTGTLNLNGGTFTKSATGSGFFDVATATGSVGTVNLNTGGTLQIPKIITEGGTSTFNFNGGTLLMNGDGTANQNNDVTFLQGLTTANIRAGGAVINTAGFNPTINQALLHSTVAGDSATTDGGLTKLGAGILTMSAANTYLGATTISAGTLTISVNGGLAKGNVNVAAGATLTLATGVTAAHNAATGTTLTLTSATTSLVTLSGTGVQDTVSKLVINGVTEPNGTYGAPGSGATFTNFADFAGSTGELLVQAVPEPSTWVLGLLGLGAAAWLRQRRVA